MTTLEIIKAAAKMGYSASFTWKKRTDGIKYPKYQVASVSRQSVITTHLSEFSNYVINEKMEIMGFIYAGHLFGEPEIPEGQRFRFKESKEIFTATGYGEDLILYRPYGPLVAKKYDVEPVFD